MNGIVWTDERVERLRKLWCDDGHSASRCAEMLEGVTRNAVISKIHRMGWKRGGTRVFDPGARRRPRRLPKPTTSNVVGMTPRPRQPTLPADPLPEPTALYVEPSKRLKLLDLENHHCRWPFEDPGHPDFGFCGGPKLLGQPYCDAHFRAAWQEPRARQPRKSEFILYPQIPQKRRGAA